MAKEQLHVGDFQKYFPNEEASDIPSTLPSYAENVDFIFSGRGSLEGIPDDTQYITDAKSVSVDKLSSRPAKGPETFLCTQLRRRWLMCTA